MKKFLPLFIIFSCIFLYTPLSGNAQEAGPALFKTTEEGPERIGMTGLDIDARIHGSLSETRMTMTFYNPSDRNIAGDLYFPLPEHAVISGYALDIGGVLVDGVPVEKQKAREVFEKIVRQGIDPGLVQWTKGNTFKTRVFPIPPRGTRTVMVRYTAEVEEKDGAGLFYLPFDYDVPVRDFSMRIEVVRPGTPPEVRQRWVTPVDFRKRRHSFFAETRLTNVLLDRDMYVTVPRDDDIRVQMERDREGNHYFTFVDRVRPTSAGRERIVPRRVAVYWDASGSRAGNSLTKSLEVLSLYFNSLPQTDVSVDLTVFRNDAEDRREFIIRRGDAGKLIGYLQGVAYDGGTRLGSLPPPGTGTDIAFLFSDGLSTFGEDRPVRFGVPLYIFSEDRAANFHLLRHLARENHGLYTNLTTGNPGEIIDDIGAPAFEFIAARVVAGSVSEIFPAQSRPVSDRIRISGKLESPMAELAVQYGRGGKVEAEHFVTLSRSSAEEGFLVGLAWAEQKLSGLLSFPDRNRALITDLGKKFGMVTPGTLSSLANFEKFFFSLFASIFQFVYLLPIFDALLGLNLVRAGFQLIDFGIPFVDLGVQLLNICIFIGHVFLLVLLVAQAIAVGIHLRYIIEKHNSRANIIVWG